MSNSHVTFLAKVTAKLGAEAQLADALRALVAPTRQEAGCLEYIPNVSPDDPRSFTIYESWRDEAAFVTHTTMPYVVALMARMPDLVEGPPTREMLNALT